MSRLPFGTRVDVAAVVEPRYLTWKTAYDPFRPPVLIDPRHEDIGDPLPDTTGVPAEGLHRRLRRFHGLRPVWWSAGCGVPRAPTTKAT